jgi:UDP-N-acetyl-D-glucosamine dehydrogenase
MLEELLENTSEKVVVIESSCYVGMTREIFKEFYDKFSAYVFHSAERYDEGRTEPMFEDIPKVIGPVIENTQNKALEFYTNAFSRMVPVSNSETSEMSKLTENC